MKIIKLLAIATLLPGIAGCNYRPAQSKETITITDQAGRTETIPKGISRIAALHHFGGLIVFALGQQQKLVEQSLYGKVAAALSKVDPQFASMPKTADGHSVNYESLIALRPQCAFVYASFNDSDMKRLEDAGIKVIALKGETIEESFAAIRIVARALDCVQKGEDYIASCQNIVSMVADRTKDIPREKRLRVMFTGPKSIYSAATGEMLQNQMIELAGAINVARQLKGFWGDVSPEQVAQWNPDAIFLASSLSVYAIDGVLKNSQVQSFKAIRNKNVYVFPSNVGWWDYPAPHCVLGALWTAKTLYPERFKDVDVLKIADDFYLKYVGHTFTSLGGKL